ncbi:MAG: hypothetical protein D6728_06160 [Cyanobacteria bacterium J055]|nr:MAG: hypothetical protein D6728_06160 [Cyanobacteria bacterium J055]
MTSQSNAYPNSVPSIVPLHGDTPDADEFDARFELLSAYLDGEVNDKERQQVETWLAADPQFQQLHDRMSSLNGSIQAIPVPTAASSAKALADGIFERDRFELLSACLDGEVDGAERQQVEVWLATDAETRTLYHRMSSLHRDIQSIPVPVAASAQQLADGVFSRIDRQRRRRNLRWGGAVAAAFVAVVSGMTLANRSFSPQMAQSPQEGDGADPTVALNRDGTPAAVSPNAPSEPSIVSRALFVE